MNARESSIPYPWLVFKEKVKVKSVFLRDSTAVSDSMLLLFGGSILKGDMVNHVHILFVEDLFGAVMIWLFFV